jgi:protein O-mannosyl-transferase
MPQKKQQPAISGKARAFSKREIMAIILIITLGGIVYGRCVTYDYVLYDDPKVIFQNPDVLAGFSPSGVYWAFTNPNFGLYQPLPTISYMIDREFFGDWPGGYHLVTLLWHLLCAATLFIVLLRLFKNFPVALMAALLFTVHPVQSMVVNWIIARNEIMVTLFALLCVEFYRQYASKKDYRAGVFSLGFMLLAFMCKQGIVLLPVVLLVLDYWPLKRIEIKFDDLKKTLGAALTLALEKLPWAAIGGIGVFLAFFGKTQFRILDKNNLMSPLDNLGFAFVAYIRYLYHLLYPVHYVTSYSTATDWLKTWMVISAFAILVVITLTVLFAYKRRPYMLVGWAWFVLLLLPVSGLVRYNSESIALRYLYAPSIGLYLLISFLLYELFRSKTTENELDGSTVVPMGFKVVSGGLVLLLAIVCFWQSGFWKNSEVLAQRAIAATDDNNAIAHNHLADIRIRQKLYQQAEMHMRKAMELEPNIKVYTHNYAVLLMRQERYQEAHDLLEPIVSENRHLVSIVSQYGAALLALKQLDKAREYLERAVEMEPAYVPALFNLAFCLSQQNEKEKARQYLQRVLELQPNHANANALLNEISNRKMR